jgi:prolyl-tRNA synthetase
LSSFRFEETEEKAQIDAFVTQLTNELRVNDISVKYDDRTHNVQFKFAEWELKGFFTCAVGANMQNGGRIGAS